MQRVKIAQAIKKSENNDNVIKRVYFKKRSKIRVSYHKNEILSLQPITLHFHVTFLPIIDKINCSKCMTHIYYWQQFIFELLIKPTMCTQCVRVQHFQVFHDVLA